MPEELRGLGGQGKSETERDKKRERESQGGRFTNTRAVLPILRACEVVDQKRDCKALDVPD